MTNRASRTAQYVALFRALESTLPANVRLFADPLAPCFLDRRLHLVAALSRVRPIGDALRWQIDRRWPGPRGAVAARTRLIDTWVVDALREGIRQVALLGAGFDTRPYRLPEFARVKTFEVDREPTLDAKRAALTRRLAQQPTRVTFVPIDFERDKVDARLVAHGFLPDVPSVFVWEGVTNYLTADAVDAALRAIARLGAPGSWLIFTYVERQVLDGTTTVPGAAESIRTVRRAGEPFTFGLRPEEVRAYIARHHFRLDCDLAVCDAPAQARARGGRPVPVSSFYHVARATIDPRGSDTQSL